MSSPLKLVTALSIGAVFFVGAFAYSVRRELVDSVIRLPNESVQLRLTPLGSSTASQSISNTTRKPQ